MLKYNFRWDIILLIEVLFTVFLTSFFPESWHQDIYYIMYVSLYFTSIITLDQQRKVMLMVAVVSVIFTGLVRFWNTPVIESISVGLDVIFFGLIVMFLIRKISHAHTVTERVILQAVTGYLLLGIVFTFLIGLVVDLDPGAFNFTAGAIKPHDFMYFGFITFTTTGYGDFLPLKPWSQSLTIFIAMCGQLYVAIIIALLVGKFSTQSRKS